MVLAVQNLRVQYGARVLFNDLSFTVEDGERIALAGHNGAGKSTLMKCIAGLNEPDSGSIIKSRHSQVGYLPQEGIHIRGRRLIDEAMSAFADLMDLQERIDALTREMAGLDPRSAAYSEVLNEIGELELVLHAHNSARLRPRTESILRGLGFKDRDFDRDCGEFSGGWQMRIALAKLLLREPEVLLLDEPTNHLDIDAKEVVEDALLDFEGTLIIVSHDRYLLQKLPTRIFELTTDGIVEYKGRFDYYLQKKEERKAAESSGEESKSTSDGELSAEEERRLRKEQEAEQRRQERRIKELEGIIEDLEAKIQETEEILCAPENMSNVELLQEKGELLEQYKAELEVQYEEWMELQ